MRRLSVLAVLVSLLLAGCSSSEPATAGNPILDDFGLAGLQTAQIIDRLDRLGGDDRPAELMASVRPDELLLATDQDELALPMPEDRFYLSVAPYLSQTHECFFHSLTTCQGEMVGEDVQVTIVDSAGAVLVDEQVTTFANGFAGFWLPRDVDATLTIEQDGRTGTADISTDDDSPSCLTTVQLV